MQNILSQDELNFILSGPPQTGDSASAQATPPDTRTADRAPERTMSRSSDGKTQQTLFNETRQLHFARFWQQRLQEQLGGIVLIEPNESSGRTLPEHGASLLVTSRPCARAACLTLDKNMTGTLLGKILGGSPVRRTGEELSQLDKRLLLKIMEPLPQSLAETFQAQGCIPELSGFLSDTLTESLLGHSSDKLYRFHSAIGDTEGFFTLFWTEA